GVPFRTAHHIVGQLVATAEAEGLALSELTLDTFQEASDAIAKDVYQYLTAKNVVKRYAPDGAGGKKQLAKQLRFWTRKLQ
ncbi:MAG: argininosuccinate lyase, partial [Phycisphaerales bacterium]|nr:argininosuccinate lyase [Phycisphaerales bacterium]